MYFSMIYLNIIVPFSGRSSKGSFSKGFCKNSVWMSHLAQKKIKKLHGPSCNGTWISDTTKSRTDHLTRPWGSSIHLPASPFLNSFRVKLLLWLWMRPVSFPALLFECELTTRMQVLSSLPFYSSRVAVAVVRKAQCHGMTSVWPLIVS